MVRWVQRLGRSLCVVIVLAGLSSTAPTWAQRPRGVQSEAEEAAEARVIERVDRTVSGHFSEQPLQKVLDDWARAADVTIRLDVRALEDVLIAPDAPVTFKTDKLPLQTALRAILGRLDLTWVVDHGTVLVTTPEKAGNMLIVKIYPVYDLVSADRRNFRPGGYQHLMDLLTNNLAPTTWDEVGGPGAIHEFRPSGALIVTQTFEVHQQIEPLLNTLRRVRDDQHIPHEKKPPTAGATAERRVGSTGRRPPPDRPSATVLLAPHVYD